MYVLELSKFTVTVPYKTLERIVSADGCKFQDSGFRF